MKKNTELFIFAIISLFIVFSACNKENIDDKEDFIVAEDSDPIAYDYFVWYDTNMQNALFESGQTVFIFINHPGYVEETDTYIIDDTTVTINRKKFNHDSCQYLVIDTFPRKVEDYYINQNNVSIENVSQKENNGWKVTFSGAIGSLNNGEENNHQIIVTGNQVNVPGLGSFNVNEPTTFGPPLLSAILAESLNNPPARPTQAQIDALSCGEVVGWYLADRLISVTTKSLTKWVVVGNLIHIFNINYSITFSHSWYYRCPDGPLVRKVLCIVAYSSEHLINGVPLSTTSWQVGYSKHHNN